MVDKKRAPGFDRVPGNPMENPGRPVPTGTGLTDPVSPQTAPTSPPPEWHTNTPGRPGATPRPPISVDTSFTDDRTSELGARSQQFGAQGAQGVGTTALGEMAGGGWTRGMQGQHDALQRSIMARMAGVRGSQNVGLGARTAVAESEGARKDFIQKNLDREFQVAGAKATLEGKEFEINKKVESDLQKHRDELTAKYEEMGLRGAELEAKIAAELQRLKEQLTHEYWKTDRDSQTAIDVTRMQESDWIRTDPAPYTPGYTQEGQFQDQYWDNSPSSQSAEGVTPGYDSVTPSSTMPQETWDTMTDEEKQEYRAFYDLGPYEEDTGGPEDDPSYYDTGGPEDDILSIPSVNDYRERPTKFEFDHGQKPSLNKEVDPDQIEVDARNEAMNEINAKIDWINRGLVMGAGAYQLGSAKNSKERRAAALSIMKSKATATLAQKAGQLLSDKIGGTSAGALAGATTGVAKEALDDNKTVSQKERLKHAATKGAATGAGATLGGAAGKAAGLMTGPAAPLVTPALSVTGSTLGGWGAGELHDAISPKPGVRTTNPQQMVSSSMGPASPGALKSDPLSFIEERDQDYNALPYEDRMSRRTGETGSRSWDVGGPEDDPSYQMQDPLGEALEVGAPQIELPANDSYDFLENISSSEASEGGPGGPSTPQSDTISALGDLHERLKQIELLVGGGM